MNANSLALLTSGRGYEVGDPSAEIVAQLVDCSERHLHLRIADGHELETVALAHARRAAEGLASQAGGKDNLGLKAS